MPTVIPTSSVIWSASLRTASAGGGSMFHAGYPVRKPVGPSQLFIRDPILTFCVVWTYVVCACLVLANDTSQILFSGTGFTKVHAEQRRLDESVLNSLYSGSFV